LIYAFALAAGIPLILMSWGFQPRDMQLWLFNLFTEINIGTIRISIFGILGGLLLFVVGLMLTRWFQKWLDGNVMARSQVDGGVRNSVKMGVGYLGTGIAGIVGISAAGIDLSSLALVAGALSLGIGFGLQNIVSNFVSGLILLVERPFKVGDHVITGVNEGIVKRISVRATEIETFRRQSIIVPNSELINTPLGNWTHRNKVQRSEIPVSVAYDADPQEVIDVLLSVVNGMPDILRNPEPHVEFLRFGASSLDFELRFHLADMGEGLDVRNRVRMEILRAFRGRGIVMPYPHQDVMLHIREQDRNVLLRRRSKLEAERKPEADELPAEADDDKLLP
jgi:potassium-dependent mechanosensitive channel